MTRDRGAIHKLKPRSFNKSFSAPTSLTVRQSLLFIIAKYIPLRHSTLLWNGVCFLIIIYISFLWNSVLDMIPWSCFLQMSLSAAGGAPSPQTTTIRTLLSYPCNSGLKYSRWCNKLVSVLLWSKVRHFYDHRSWLLLCNLTGEP